MAKYKVVKYDSKISDDSCSCDYVFIDCDLKSKNGKITTHYYRFTKDDNCKDLQLLKSILDVGFEYAKNNNDYIEIQKNTHRLYLNLTLPDKGGNITEYQFTGEKIKK